MSYFHSTLNYNFSHLPQAPCSTPRENYKTWCLGSLMDPFSGHKFSAGYINEPKVGFAASESLLGVYYSTLFVLHDDKHHHWSIIDPNL